MNKQENKQVTLSTITDGLLGEGFKFPTLATGIVHDNESFQYMELSPCASPSSDRRIFVAIRGHVQGLTPTQFRLQRSEVSGYAVRLKLISKGNVKVYQNTSLAHNTDVKRVKEYGLLLNTNGAILYNTESPKVSYSSKFQTTTEKSLTVAEYNVAMPDGLQEHVDNMQALAVNEEAWRVGNMLKRKMKQNAIMPTIAVNTIDMTSIMHTFGKMLQPDNDGNITRVSFGQSKEFPTSYRQVIDGKNTIYHLEDNTENHAETMPKTVWNRAHKLVLKALTS